MRLDKRVSSGKVKSCRRFPPLQRSSVRLTAEPALSGATIVRLMRARRITIRALAQRMNITLKRVRHVRTHGVCGVAFVLDWLEALGTAAANEPGPDRSVCEAMPTANADASANSRAGHDLAIALDALVDWVENNVAYGMPSDMLEQCCNALNAAKSTHQLSAATRGGRSPAATADEDVLV